MQTNLSVNNVQPAFKAKISRNFVHAAENYFNGVEYNPDKVKPFIRKVKDVNKNFGYDEFTITYKKNKVKNSTTHSLYADNGKYKVPITQKDQFRKLIEKFMHLTKGELYIKIKQFRQEHPEFRKLNSDIKMPEFE